MFKGTKPKNWRSFNIKATLEVLEKIENKNTFETEKVLALVFDKPLEVHEKLKPQKDNSVRLEITLTQEQFAELEQAKNLLSQYHSKDDTD